MWVHQSHGNNINIKETSKVSVVLGGFLDRQKRLLNLVVHNLLERPEESKAGQAATDVSLFTYMERKALHINCKPSIGHSEQVRGLATELAC